MFSELIQVIVWAAGVLVLLLMILTATVAHFLKEMHKDFKDLKKIVGDLIADYRAQEEERIGEYKLLKHRLDEHDQDIRVLQKEVDVVKDRL